MTRLLTDKPRVDHAPTPTARSRPARPEPSGSWQLLIIPIMICVALLTYASLTF
jgi:hypothetical protein